MCGGIEFSVVVSAVLTLNQDAVDFCLEIHGHI